MRRFPKGSDLVRRILQVFVNQVILQFFLQIRYFADFVLDFGGYCQTKYVADFIRQDILLIFIRDNILQFFLNQVS